MRDLYQWTGRFFSLRNNYLFISLFLSLFTVFELIVSSDLTITDFSKLIPGIASFENADVSKRVHLLYTSVLLFCAVFIVCVLLFYRLNKLQSVKKTVFVPWNRLAAAGILLLFFTTVYPYIYSPALFLYGVVSFTLLLFQVCKYILKIRILSTYSSFIWLSLLSFSCAFCLRDLLQNFTDIEFYKFHVSYFVCFAGLSFLAWVSGHRWSYKKAFYVSLPLFVFPLISVLSREVYLILNQRNIFFLSPVHYYVLAFIIIIAFCVRNYFKKKPEFRIRKYFKYYIYPIVLAGILIFTNYRPFLNQPEDLFELANPANAVMRLIDYHELPVLQALSSHVLSDINLKLLYVVLNGYHGSVDFMLYDFLTDVIFVLVFYFFLSGILKDSLLVFLSAVFIPFISAAVLGSQSLVFISILLMYRLAVAYDFRKLIWVGAWSLFLILWKIEVGISSLAACMFIYLLFFVFQFRKKLISDALKVTLLFGIIGVLVFASCIIAGIDVWGNFLQAMDYFGANQAHGFSLVTYQPDRIFYLHYFIFPAVSVLIFFYVLFKEGKKFARPDLLASSIIFLLVYYFVQAQRGLVRHSLVEGSDLFFSSFFYLIISLFIYYLVRERLYAKYLFVVVFIFTVYNFELSPGGNSNYRELYNTFLNNPPISTVHCKIDRVNGTKEFAENNYLEIKSFLDQNFEKDATFLDFSNTPMLYFYTGRRVPSYFNQYMQNTVTKFLQEKNIEYLKTLNVPVVIFSHDQDSWWDHTDRVPNTIRYNLTAEYIFRNYEPLAVLNHHYIWIRKGHIKLNGAAFVQDTFIYNATNYQLKKYPFLLAKTKDIANARVMQSWNPDSAYQVNPSQNKYRNYLLLHISNSSGSEKNLTLHYYRNENELGSFEFEVIPSREETYAIPLSSQYNWVDEPVNKIKISPAENIIIKRIDLLAGK